jgi:hypothetical protein
MWNLLHNFGIRRIFAIENQLKFIMIEETVLLRVLAEQKEEVQGLHHQQWIDRKEEALFELNSPLAQVVIGVRRSGKSTLCHKFLKQNNINYGYANLDDDRLVDMEVKDLNSLLSCIYQLYGTDVPYLFFDEIQNVDGWHLFVNRLLRTGIHIFVTGSNAKLLSSELATHLTGRYNEIRLYTFSFSEYCAFHGVDVKSITTKAEAERKRRLVEYLNEGGFPEMQNMRNKRGYIQSLLEAILQKDVRSRFKIRDTEVLHRLAYHVINNVCQLINYGEMSQLLGVTDKTTKKYMGYLQQAFLVQLLSKHSFKSRGRIFSEKAYVVDTGLINYRDASMAGENLGWRMENVVYIELLRRCAREYLDVYYYRPNARAKEVDFVVCNQSRAVELIQVAYDISSEKTFRREVTALLNAGETLGCNTRTLIAYAPSRTVIVDGKTIEVVSIVDWLLAQ